jgi:hypothetical protein
MAIAIYVLCAAIVCGVGALFSGLIRWESFQRGPLPLIGGVLFLLVAVGLVAAGGDLARFGLGLLALQVGALLGGACGAR